MIEIRDPDTYVRPIYAGNALATVQADGQGPRMLTVRPTAFRKAVDQETSAPVAAVSEEELQAAQQAAAASEWIDEDLRDSGAHRGCNCSGPPRPLCVGVCRQSVP